VSQSPGLNTPVVPPFQNAWASATFSRICTFVKPAAPGSCAVPKIWPRVAALRNASSVGAVIAAVGTCVSKRKVAPAPAAAGFCWSFVASSSAKEITR